MAEIVVLFIIFTAMTGILMSICRKIELADAIVHSVLLEILLFAISTCVLYPLGIYSVGRALILDMAVTLILLFVLLAVRKAGFEFNPEKRWSALVLCLIIFAAGCVMVKQGIFDESTLMGKIQKNGLWLSQGTSGQAVYEEVVGEFEGYTELNDTVYQMTEYAPHISPSQMIPAALTAGTSVVFGYRLMLYWIPFVIALLAYELYLIICRICGRLKKERLTDVLAAVFVLISGICVLTLILKPFGNSSYHGFEMYKQLDSKVIREDILVLDSDVSEELMVPVRAVTGGSAVTGQLESWINAYTDLYADELSTGTEYGVYSVYSGIGNLYYITDKKLSDDRFTEVFDGDYKVYQYNTGETTPPVSDSPAFYRYLALLFGAALLCVCVVYIAAGIGGLKAAKRVVALVGAAVLLLMLCCFLSKTHGNIFSIVIAVLTLAAAFFGLAVLYRKRDAVELAVLAVTGSVFGYILISALLLALNTFSVHKCMTITLILWIITDCVIYFVRRSLPAVTFEWKKTIIPVVICIIVMPLMFFCNGMFGMGQDEGVYAVRAYSYLQGYNDNYMSFSEYDNIVSEEEKSQFMSVLNEKMTGYYFPTYDETVGRAGDSVVRNETIGYYHGINTFAALLALWGSIAGTSNMLQWGIICLLLSVMLLWLTMRGLGISQRISTFALLLYVSAPQLLWQSKTSLVETTLGLVVLAFIYLITDKQWEQYRPLSCIAVAVFAVLHITIYVFMPMFVLIYYYLFLKNKKKSYMAGALVSIAAYLGGFYMMYITSRTYTYGNYDRMYHFGINSSNLKMFVTVFCVAAMIFTALLMFVIPAFKSFALGKSGKQSKAATYIMVYAAVIISLLGCIYSVHKSTLPLNGQTIFAYWLASGMLCIPVIIAGAFIKPGIFRKNDSIVVLSGMFLYCVVIYSVVFKREVIYYNYYGRYIVPYVSIILILAAYVFYQMRLSFVTGKNVQRAYKTDFVSFIFVMIVLAVLVPYAAVSAIQQDETEVQWSTLQELQDNIAVTTEQEKTAVILDESLARQFMLPVKYATSADIYICNDNVTEQIRGLKQQYSHVYYLTDEEMSNGQFNILCDIQNKVQIDTEMPQEITDFESVIPYATDHIVYWQRILMYE